MASIMFGSLPTSVLFIVVVLYAREAVTQPDYVDQYPEVIVEDDCNENVFTWSGGMKMITHQYTQTDKECHYQILNLETPDEFRLTFTQSDGNPIQYANKSSTNCTDTENFIRISNHLDIHGQDKDMSFLFCGDEYPPPYVSVLQTAHVDVKHDHELLVVFKIEDLSKVKCTEDTFQCSYSECIEKRQACDGIKDCTSGQDEYCVTDFTTFTTPASSVCFMCNNGQCIRPILSVYDEYDLESGLKRGELWWLCDHKEHCEDGTDESNGACGNFSTPTDAFFSCVPRLISTNNSTVNILQTKWCDDTEDCLYGEDEADCVDDNKDTDSSEDMSADTDGDTDTDTDTHTDTNTNGMAGWQITLICLGVIAVLGICAGVCCYVNRAKIPGCPEGFKDSCGCCKCSCCTYESLDRDADPRNDLGVVFKNESVQNDESDPINDDSAACL